MSTPQENTEDARFIQLLASLPYACSTVERLAGGSVNHICRGTLLNPLPDGSQSVIVRQCLDETRYVCFFLAIERISFDPCLQNAELAFLQLIKGADVFPLDLDKGVSVRPPHLYHFIPESRIQLVEDKVDHQLLKSFLLSPPPEPLIQDKITSIGEAIGRWLASFHAWGQGQIDEDLLDKFRRNEDLHCKTPSPLYEAVANQCDDETLRQAVLVALNKKDQRVQGVIHGDFSPRKYALSSRTQDHLLTEGKSILIQYSSLPAGPELAVIDWETITYENQLHDFANMMAVIYIQNHLSEAPSFGSILQGFVRGYRELNADLLADAFILIGVWILFFRQIMLRFDVSHPSQLDPQGKLKRLAIDLISKGAKGNVGPIESEFSEFLSST